MWRINVFISACCCTVVSVVGGRSRLHLLDLGSCGRAKDGSALSLTSLGSVLLALLSGQRHIPHRSVSTSSFYPSATLDWPKAYCFLLVRPSVRPSVRLSVHSFVHRYCETRYFENEWTDFVENWQKWSTGQGDETVSFWGQEIKDQDHTIPKLDLEVWRRHRSGPLVQ